MFLRNAGHIILSVLLLAATIGIATDKHYSGDKLFSVSIFGEAESCCDGPCDCCHNEKQTFQVKDDFLSTYYTFDKILFINIICFIGQNNLFDVYSENHSDNVSLYDSPRQFFI